MGMSSVTDLTSVGCLYPLRVLEPAAGRWHKRNKAGAGPPRVRPSVFGSFRRPGSRPWHAILYNIGTSHRLINTPTFRLSLSSAKV